MKKKKTATETPVISNDKYESTGETKIWFGVTLHRIRAKRSFGLVVAGALGGFVASEANLQVYGNAWVYGNAQVYGNAWVSGNAQVYGDARVYGDAWVYGDARVYGNAWVYGDARVYGNARVYGDARVYGNAWVYGDARVYGDAQVYGNARVYGVIQMATRSDGYAFVVAPTAEGARIIAGCRYFTIAEARAHWTNTRGGTPLGEESLALVDFLERMATIRGFIEPVAPPPSVRQP